MRRQNVWSMCLPVVIGSDQCQQFVFRLFIIADVPVIAKVLYESHYNAFGTEIEEHMHH